MADDHEERFRQHEAIMEGLARMLAEQRNFNQHIAGLLQEQRQFNQQQVEINADVKTTLARIETLLARMLALYQHSCHQPQSSKDDHAMVWG